MKYQKQALKLLNNVIKENELLLLTLTHEDRNEKVRQWANNAMEWAIDKEKKELEENILLEEKRKKQEERIESIEIANPTTLHDILNKLNMYDKLLIITILSVPLVIILLKIIT